MPRPKFPLAQMWHSNPGHISRMILEELTLYAKDKQVYPIQNQLFHLMTDPQYNKKTNEPIPPRYPEIVGKGNTFDYWFGRLVEEGYIEIDWPTRSIRCTKLAIVDMGDKPED
jgi:hypothetical protein